MHIGHIEGEKSEIPMRRQREQPDEETKHLIYIDQ